MEIQLHLRAARKTPTSAHSGGRWGQRGRTCIRCALTIGCAAGHVAELPSVAISVEQEDLVQLSEVAAPLGGASVAAATVRSAGVGWQGDAQGASGPSSSINSSASLSEPLKRQPFGTQSALTSAPGIAHQATRLFGSESISA